MTSQTCNPSIVTQALGIQATGPRTVIVPADPIIWDEETSYEYLTLVASTDFGQAYISKRDVPSGTPLTDTDYWIPAARYNAQLASLQNDIGNMNNSINGLETAIDAITPFDTFPTSDSAKAVTSGGIFNVSSVFNAKAFGCVGDGVTDDTANLQNAIDFCSENKFTLYIPAGRYVISSALVLKNNTAIVGCGVNDNYMSWQTGPTTDSTVIIQTIANKNVIEGGVNEDLNSVYIAGMALYNKAILDTYTWPEDYVSGLGDGIYLNRCSKFAIDRVFVHHCYNGFRVLDTKVGDSTPYISSGEQKYLSNCSAQNCYVGYFYTASDAFAVNIVAGNCHQGMEVGTVKVSNVHLWACYNFGIAVHSSSQAQFSCLEMEGIGLYAIDGHTSDRPDGATYFNCTNGGTALIESANIWNVVSLSNTTMFRCSNGLIDVNSLVISRPNDPPANIPNICWANVSDIASISIGKIVISGEFNSKSESAFTGNVFVGAVVVSEGSTYTNTKDKITKLGISNVNTLTAESYNPYV